MNIELGEFIGAIIVAALTGGVIAALWDAGEIREAARLGYSRGCAATRASMRDAFSLLPRLHCSRSIAGHIRLADVERLIGGVDAGIPEGCKSREDVLH